MLRLNINNFSIVKNADVEISEFTVLIGRQASGKSVISKLGYFLSSKLREGLFGFDEFDNLVKFKSSLKSDFLESFPSSLWGDGGFYVSISCSSLSITLSGSSGSGDRPSLNVDLSPHFKEIFQFSQKCYKVLTEKEASKDAAKNKFVSPWRIKQDVSEKIDEKIRSLCGVDLGYSYFIPAGRAFYTSVGRMLSVVESDIDVFTKQFGRLWANFYDFSFDRHGSTDGANKIHSLIYKIFDGEFKKKKNKVYLRSRDGRDIPLHMMSSGQQELFPVWVLMSELRPFDRRRFMNYIFIEEPEAHLFPDAQSAVTEFLASSTFGPGGGSAFVTTHSPYILSTINLLLMAHSVGQESGLAQLVSKVVSKECWLSVDRVRAYCVSDGIVKNIVGEDGLIGENYIDSVSGVIFEKFQNLMEISSRAS